jgi:hypothetical protein
MNESEASGSGDVSISIELSGKYDQEMSKLSSSPHPNPAVEAMTDDCVVLLETIDRIDGGTKSAVASALPDDTTVSYDANAVVEALQVLARNAGRSFV